MFNMETKNMGNPEYGSDEEELEDSDLGIIDKIESEYGAVKRFFSEVDQKLVDELLKTAEINFAKDPSGWTSLLEELSRFFDELSTDPESLDEDEVTSNLQLYFSRSKGLVQH